MMKSFAFIIQCFIALFKPDVDLYVENILLKKENEILKRKLFHHKKRLILQKFEKMFFILLNLISSIQNKVSLFSPATLLKWQKRLIAGFWSFFQSDTHPGRPPVPSEVKELILSMKNNNLTWGAKRIRDELLKLDIDLHKKTIQSIIENYRRKNRIRNSYTWKQFLAAQIDSLFSMDLFAVDSLFHHRVYVFFIICHTTREIVQCAIAQYPTKEFVRQQIIAFEHTVNRSVYLIHDLGSMFTYIDYSLYGINNVCTSVRSPNMNSIAERFVRSIRNEALDHFIIFNGNQISKIIKDYIEFYNYSRPHQGVSRIPKGIPPDVSSCSHTLEGIVASTPILGGLHNHYFYRKGA